MRDESREQSVWHVATQAVEAGASRRLWPGGPDRVRVVNSVSVSSVCARA